MKGNDILQTMDARDWAKEFLELNSRHARVHVLEFEDGTQVRQPTPFTPAEAAKAKFYFQSQTDANDEDMMISWFSNAIMCGWDHHRFRSKEYKRSIRRVMVPWWKRLFVPLDNFGR